jgi:hypothetical protein
MPLSVSQDRYNVKRLIAAHGADAKLTLAGEVAFGIPGSATKPPAGV